MATDPYRKHAAWYDVLVEPFIVGVRSKSLSLHVPASGASVLEVGCGTGTNLASYKAAGCRVYGVDLSAAMIAQARKKLSAAAYLQVGDASQMPYPNDRFDFILAMLTLHEMPFRIRPKVIKEMVRVLKPQGRVMLVDYRIGPLAFPIGWIAKGIVFAFERLAGGNHYKNYCNFIRHRGLEPLLTGGNLTVHRQATSAGGNVALYLLGRDVSACRESLKKAGMCKPGNRSAAGPTPTRKGIGR